MTLPVANTDLAAYYARRAAEYEQVYAKPERQADLARLRALLRDRLAGTRLLEIACGTGYWTEVLAAHVAAITAGDINPGVLALARAKAYPPGRVRFRRIDAYTLAGIPGRFTAGFAGFWWSHVPLERLDAFLARWHRRLGPGARAVFVDNRYVAGSNHPIARTDAGGNTYQLRRLADGSTHEVLKNFPTAADLRARVAPAAADLAIVELDYYWCLSYRIAAPEARP